MNIINKPYTIFQLPGITDDRGSLICLEAMKSIPFEIKRIFYIFNNKNNKARGMHAHKRDRQFLFCMAGHVSVHLDAGILHDVIKLDSPEKGILVEPMVWLELKDFSADCCLMVVSNNTYDEHDYIRSYAQFIAEKKAFVNHKLKIGTEEGKTVRIRPVTIDDYIFIHNCRKSVARSEFLSEISDNPELQKVWIEEYKVRESLGEEMYFIIERLDTNQPIGTFRVYSPEWERARVSCGSWILNDQKTPSAAIETIMLITRILQTFGLRYILIDTNKENKTVLRFIKKISTRFYCENETNVFYEICSADFLNNTYSKYKKFIE